MVGKTNILLPCVFFTPVLITMMNVAVKTLRRQRECFHSQFFLCKIIDPLSHVKVTENQWMYEILIRVLHLFKRGWNDLYATSNWLSQCLEVPLERDFNPEGLARMCACMYCAQQWLRKRLQVWGKGLFVNCLFSSFVRDKWTPQSNIVI